MIEIDKGIPIPPKMGGSGKKPIFPWRDMEVGDSFFVAGKKRFSGTATMGQRIGGKFVQRLVEGGCRIWRVE